MQRHKMQHVFGFVIGVLFLLQNPCSADRSIDGGIPSISYGRVRPIPSLYPIAINASSSTSAPESPSTASTSSASTSDQSSSTSGTSQAADLAVEPIAAVEDKNDEQDDELVKVDNIEKVVIAPTNLTTSIEKKDLEALKETKIFKSTLSGQPEPPETIEAVIDENEPVKFVSTSSTEKPKRTSTSRHHRKHKHHHHRRAQQKDRRQMKPKVPENQTSTPKSAPPATNNQEKKPRTSEVAVNKRNTLSSPPELDPVVGASEDFSKKLEQKEEKRDVPSEEENVKELKDEADSTLPTTTIVAEVMYSSETSHPKFLSPNRKRDAELDLLLRKKQEQNKLLQEANAAAAALASEENNEKILDAMKRNLEMQGVVVQNHDDEEEPELLKRNYDGFRETRMLQRRRQFSPTGDEAGVQLSARDRQMRRRATRPPYLVLDRQKDRTAARSLPPIVFPAGPSMTDRKLPDDLPEVTVNKRTAQTEFGIDDGSTDNAEETELQQRGFEHIITPVEIEKGNAEAKNSRQAEEFAFKIDVSQWYKNFMNHNPEENVSALQFQTSYDQAVHVETEIPGIQLDDKSELKPEEDVLQKDRAKRDEMHVQPNVTDRVRKFIRKLVRRCAHHGDTCTDVNCEGRLLAQHSPIEDVTTAATSLAQAVHEAEKKHEEEGDAIKHRMVKQHLLSHIVDILMDELEAANFDDTPEEHVGDDKSVKNFDREDMFRRIMFAVHRHEMKNEGYGALEKANVTGNGDPDKNLVQVVSVDGTGNENAGNDDKENQVKEEEQSYMLKQEELTSNEGKVEQETSPEAPQDPSTDAKSTDFSLPTEKDETEQPKIESSNKPEEPIEETKKTDAPATPDVTAIKIATEEQSSTDFTMDATAHTTSQQLMTDEDQSREGGADEQLIKRLEQMHEQVPVVVDTKLLVVDVNTSGEVLEIVDGLEERAEKLESGGGEVLAKVVLDEALGKGGKKVKEEGNEEDLSNQQRAKRHSATLTGDNVAIRDFLSPNLLIEQQKPEQGHLLLFFEDDSEPQILPRQEQGMPNIFNRQRMDNVFPFGNLPWLQQFSRPESTEKSKVAFEEHDAREEESSEDMPYSPKKSESEEDDQREAQDEILAKNPQRAFDIFRGSWFDDAGSMFDGLLYSAPAVDDDKVSTNRDSGVIPGGRHASVEQKRRHKLLQQQEFMKYTYWLRTIIIDCFIFASILIVIYYTVRKTGLCCSRPGKTVMASAAARNVKAALKRQQPAGAGANLA